MKDKWDMMEKGMKREINRQHRQYRKSENEKERRKEKEIGTERSNKMHHSVMFGESQQPDRK